MRIGVTASTLGLVLLLAVHSALSEPVEFVEVGAERGIGAYLMANGKGASVTAADFDDDGDIDFFFPTAEGTPDQLYRNLGDGHFEEIAQQAGVASMARSRASLWFDYDGDGLLDLFVAGDCWNLAPNCPDTSTLRLYHQIADAVFEDVTLQAGLTDDLIERTNAHRGGAAAVDINNDGYLDLLTGLWAGEARLFLNQGDGTFADISLSSGIGGIVGEHWQPMAHDFNGDGWQDIYWAIDFRANHLWLNNGDNTFTDVAQTVGIDNAWNDMGQTWGDYDNDGDFDVYVANITTSGSRHNRLYRNDSEGGSLQFQPMARALGVDSGGWGWGVTFFDADNDGDLDLAETNGWFNGTGDRDPSKFFLNSGTGLYAFEDFSAQTGFNDTLWGTSLVAADFDRDGDLDLIQSCNGSGSTEAMIRILENRQGPDAELNNYLVVKPRMPGPNRRAIGAVVRADAGNLQMARLITAGTSFCGQEPAEAFFGLGSAEIVERILIEWPDGTETILLDVAANQTLTVMAHGPSEGEPAPEGEDEFPPAPPSGLEAHLGLDKVVLSWQTDEGSNVVGFNVYRGTSSSPLEQVYLEYVNAAGYVDEELPDAPVIYYSVTAIDSAGNESARATPVSVEKGAIVVTIPNVSVLAGEIARIPINVFGGTGAVPTQFDFRFPVNLVDATFNENGFEAGILVERTAFSRDIGFVAGSVIPGSLLIAQVIIFDIYDANVLRGDGHMVDVLIKIPAEAEQGESGALSLAAASFKTLYDEALQVSFEGFEAALSISPDYILGDLNGDGFIRGDDAVLALDIAVKLVTPVTARQKQAGDINGDNRIDSADAVLIARLANGLPINPAQFNAKAGRRTITVSLGNVTASPGETVAFPVLISDGSGMAGLDLSLNYPNGDDELSVDSVELQALTSTFAQSNNDVGDGTFNISMCDKQNIESGLGELVLINFTVSEQASGTLRITVADLKLSAQFGDDLGIDSSVVTAEGFIEIVPNSEGEGLEGEQSDGEGEQSDGEGGQSDGEGDTEGLPVSCAGAAQFPPGMPPQYPFGDLAFLVLAFASIAFRPRSLNSPPFEN